MSNPYSSRENLLNGIKNFLVVSRYDFHLNHKDIDAIYRDSSYLGGLLKRHSLNSTPDLITHLFLLSNFLTKSSSSTIYASMKSRYNDSTIKILLQVADGKAIKKLQRKASSCAANDVFGERINEIKKLKLKLENDVRRKDADTARRSEVSSLKSSKKLCEKMSEVKKNTASILRAGLPVTKAIKSNDSMVNDLMAGGSDPLVHKMHVQRVIRESHEKEVEEIEKRHLLGLISWEEAKIAKIDATKRKQEIAKELKWEKSQLRNVIKSEHEKSVSKSKFIVRGIHLSRLVTKRRKFDVKHMRRVDAENLKNLSKKLEREVREANERDVQRKLELVKAAKILKQEKAKNHQTRKNVHVDINELRESIAILQHQINFERKSLRDRRKRIHDEHERQKQLIENTETLISVGRKYREKNSEKVSWKLKSLPSATPDLIRLREKLAHARSRISILQSDDTN